MGKQFRTAWSDSMEENLASTSNVIDIRDYVQGLPVIRTNY